MNTTTQNRFQIIGGRTYLDGKLVTVTSEPLKPANIDLTISSRGTAVNLVRALPQIVPDRPVLGNPSPEKDPWEI